MTPLTHADAHRLLHSGRRWLDNKSAAALDVHLAACPECSAYAADLARLEPALTRALHARWDHVQPPAAPAAADVPSPRGRPRRLHPALTLAAAALVLALIIVILPVLIAPPLTVTPVPAASAALPGLPSPTPPG